MTAFPWNTLAEETELTAPAAEPSHVHIPRPSRQRKGHFADLPFEDSSVHAAGCTHGED